MFVLLGITVLSCAEIHNETMWQRMLKADNMYDDMPALCEDDDDEFQMDVDPDHPKGLLLESLNTFQVYHEIIRLKICDVGHATDLFDQWLEESSKENYEVPYDSRLKINDLDPHFIAGQSLVTNMFQMWQSSSYWYDNCAMRTFYRLTSDPFMTPLLTQPAWFALLNAAIYYGNRADRLDIIHWLMKCKHSEYRFAGVQFAFWNLIDNKRINIDEVQDYFELWYGDDEIINDWIQRSGAMENFKIFSRYFMRIRKETSNNFEYIVRLIEAAKNKIQRHSRNHHLINLSQELSYFAGGTFRALMDIIEDEMRQKSEMYRRSKWRRCDCEKYVKIGERFRQYMKDLGIGDKRGYGRTVSSKLALIKRFCYEKHK